MAKKKKGSKATTNSFKGHRQIQPKAMSRVRSDVAIWKRAETQYFNPDNPKAFLIHNLLKDVMRDALLTSQVNNRKLKVVGSTFKLVKENDEQDEESTKILCKETFFSDLIGYILDSIYYGHSLIEFDWDENNPEKLKTHLLPRNNVLPNKGILLKDASEDKGLDYKTAREFGVWLLEFGKANDLGLLNKAVPHVLFKRFANSCWSELCEIYGIPPRVLKTNTQDPQALNRAERMMNDWGAAAWFIIDDTEKLDFANANTSNGEVYNGLINLANNELSLLISGAIVGQDTKHGSKGKEESSQDVLQDLVEADKTMVAQYMNDIVLPALVHIGIIPDGLSFQYDQVENVGELWSRTKEILAYKNVDDKWIKSKFGIEVTGDRQETQNPTNLSLGFFD